MNPLVVLGATGSIGRQALEVAELLGLQVDGVAARRGSNELLEIAQSHPQARVGVTSPSAEERDRFAAELGDRVDVGSQVLADLAALPGTTVVNGVVGSVGLSASVAALEAGNRLALANKESLVSGGPVVLAARDRGGGELIPVDSEHSALFQCLVGESSDQVRRLILTASGGPFFGTPRSELEDVTAAQALQHPTWDMGPRITVDSATLMNKGFEVIEAHLLFGIPYDAIEVVVHRQSVVHSLVEFTDGSIKAHLGEPDMRVPIQYAITYPDRAERSGEPFEFIGKQMTFEAPDLEAFPALALAYQAGREGGSVPAIVNAADEVAVEAFLRGRLGFLGIAEVLERTLEATVRRPLERVEDVWEVDRDARGHAAELIGGMC